MGEVVDLNTEKEEQKINKEEVSQLSAELDKLMQGGADDIGKLFAAILAMDDEHFDVLAPGLLESFQRSVNNPNDKMMLVKSLNAAGFYAEDLLSDLDTLHTTIASQEGLTDTKKNFLIQVLDALYNAIADTEGIAKKIIRVPVELCHPDAKMPQYANTTDSGMDVFALDDYIIDPGETKLIPTGLKFALPPGYELQVRPKSGRALKTKLRVANTPGTIDAGYRDEIKIIIENIAPRIKDIEYDYDDEDELHIKSIAFGEPYYIGKGEKFAQIVLQEVPKIAPYVVDSVLDIGENRGGGFGSSGLK